MKMFYVAADNKKFVHITKSILGEITNKKLNTLIHVIRKKIFRGFTFISFIYSWFFVSMYTFAIYITLKIRLSVIYQSFYTYY